MIFVTGVLIIKKKKNQCDREIITKMSSIGNHLLWFIYCLGNAKRVPPELSLHLPASCDISGRVGSNCIHSRVSEFLSIWDHFLIITSCSWALWPCAQSPFYANSTITVHISSIQPPPPQSYYAFYLWLIFKIYFFYFSIQLVHYLQFGIELSKS